MGRVGIAAVVCLTVISGCSTMRGAATMVGIGLGAVAVGAAAVGDPNDCPDCAIKDVGRSLFFSGLFVAYEALLNMGVLAIEGSTGPTRSAAPPTPRASPTPATVAPSPTASNHAVSERRSSRLPR